MREDLFWLFSNSSGSHLYLIWEKLSNHHVLSLPDLGDLSIGSGANLTETTLNRIIGHQSKDREGLNGKYNTLLKHTRGIESITLPLHFPTTFKHCIKKTTMGEVTADLILSYL